MEVYLAEYNSEWPLQFKELKHVYLSKIGHLLSGVEHVGSTSIPGLAARPILDIDLIVKGEVDLPLIIESMENLGYYFRGDLGITGRLAFKQASPFTPKDNSNRKWPEHKLYVCQQDNLGLKNHLLFRNALRQQPCLADKYSQLKQTLAGRGLDKKQYVKAKTTFIISVLKAAGINQQSLQAIIKENRTH